MRQLISAAVLLAAVAPAAAHVGLAQREATVGSTYRAALVVGHGCDGATTTQIRVEIPEGFYNVRPMPKPGWTLEMKRSPPEAFRQPRHRDDGGSAGDHLVGRRTAG